MFSFVALEQRPWKAVLNWQESGAHAREKRLYTLIKQRLSRQNLEYFNDELLKYQQGYAPLPAGFNQASFNQIEEVIEQTSEDTIAIVLELIQGNSGVHPAEYNFMQALNQLCKERNILLIIDEVQTGVGRTGKMWAYEHFDVQPDLIATAKALAGGIPIGAMISSEKVAKALDLVIMVPLSVGILFLVPLLWKSWQLLKMKT